jgi:hypothetical protein
MRMSRFLLRSVRGLMRSVLIPGLALLMVLGLMSGGSVRMSPSADVIAHELQTHHRLPAGTTVSLGKKTDPLLVKVDAEGRLAVTTPRSASLGTLISGGMDEATRLASAGRPDVPAGTAASMKP